ncbi:heterokaryon incompatibility protein domain-containing protein [Trichoderma chlorosporum]
MSTSNRLCRFCRDLFDNNMVKSDAYEHLDDLWDLEEAAKSCAVCNLMLLAVLQSATVIAVEEESVKGIEDALKLLKPLAKGCGYIIERPCKLVIRCQEFSFHKTTFRIEGRFKKSPDFNWSTAGEESEHGLLLGHILTHNGPSDDTGFYLKPLVPRVSDGELVQHLRRCLPSIVADRSFVWAAPLPRRVLDLGESSLSNTLTSQQADLKLQETAGESGIYMTLSYCWGEYDKCRSLKANLFARKQKIVFNELPLAFQQAIAFTRALQIRYLWIDALCIIQDDSDDFTREIAVMDDIYKGGFCRIAITSCKTPTESFWPPKPIIASVELPPELSLKSKQKFTSRFVTLPKSYEQDVGSGYLNQRGWVLQERLLSPRTIHFTRDHIYYEDEDEVIAEDGVTGHFAWQSCVDKTRHISRRDLFPRRDTERWESVDMTPVSRDPWLKVAEAFSKTRLTRQTDKSVALYGLVREFQRIEEYETESLREYIHLEGNIPLRRSRSTINSDEDYVSLDIDRGLSQSGSACSIQLLDTIENNRSKDSVSGLQHVYFNHEEVSQISALGFQKGCDSYDASQQSCQGSYSSIGVRQNELHIDLIWAASNDCNLYFQDTMKLPSWTWLSYDGPVKFTRDQRPSSNIHAVLSSPISEMTIIQFHTPPEPIKLPAIEASCLQLTATLLDSFCFSDEPVPPMDTRRATWDDLKKWSPFSHHPQSSTVPVFLFTISKCRKLYACDTGNIDTDSNNGKHVGYISFDDDRQIPNMRDLCLVHVSTLVDEIWLPPPKPEYREEELPSTYNGEDHDTFNTHVVLRPPILAYALVLERSKKFGDEYTRAGVAEVNLDWISRGRKETIRIN